MARKNKGRTSTRKRGTRDANVITSRRERFPQFTFQPDLFDDLQSIQSLREIEDRRTNYPTPNSRPLATIRGRSQIIPAFTNPFAPADVPAFLRFAEPERVMVCVRKKLRRKAIFAHNKAGKGGQRKPRPNPNPDVRC